jgi:hypothetical protein
MSSRALRRAIGSACCVTALALVVGAPGAAAAFDDPLAVIRPQWSGPPQTPLPPPDGDLEGPCGLAVDDEGYFYVSDYYRNAIDVFAPVLNQAYPYGYQFQTTGIDPSDGPCGLAFDGGGNLYVNGFHRSVIRYGPLMTGETVISGVGSGDDTRPTGVAVNRLSGNVYVDQRTRIGVFSSTGTLLRTLAAGTLEDGYGAAVSEFAGTQGLVYVADAASETVKVYSPDPAGEDAGPVAEIDGSGTPLGHFVSLRDAAIAIDAATGEVYVSDNLQPEFAERPETVVHVFDAAGAYEGRLKYSIENSLPPGLAVDNSVEDTQGRVYVTSGNTAHAAVYAYPPEAATNAAVPLPRSAVIDPGAVDGSSSTAEAPTAALGFLEDRALADGSPAAGAPSATTHPDGKRHRRARAHRSKRAQKSAPERRLHGRTAGGRAR